MPVYEYYCPACNGRFQHLAKRIGEPAPPCPRCGNAAVERLFSAVGLLHSAQEHQAQLKAEAAQVDADDPQAAARFLKDSGRLEDAEGLFGSAAYRELIERRTEGATDADLTDLEGDLTAQLAGDEVVQSALTAGLGLTKKSPTTEQREERDYQRSRQEPPPPTRRRRSAPDLGWR